MTELETQVQDLKDRVRSTANDAAAARVLAGGADRDANEIRDELRSFRRATTASFNALREDMTDGFARVDNHLDQLRGEVRAKFDATAAGLAHITSLLERPGDTDAR